MRLQTCAGVALVLLGALLLGGLGLMVFASEIGDRISAAAGAPAALLFGLTGMSVLFSGLCLLEPREPPRPKPEGPGRNRWRRP